ncbi:RluA family pseudouridine synthase [Mesobacillus foraminis]|uniref:RluA family pseudouridine synthase n=1 Tax=Mesobacillus foraminis TaxID=279826 RepID=UPI001BEBEA52|nr:RluA family pseudouridine synthase [Mesobacillus foraminis]MBT2756362.1 RluA family pseudouridine synthase [Mesobacillus foraminis]
MGNQFKLAWAAEPEDQGKMLREFLSSREISKAALTDIKFKGGRLLVNGSPVTVRRILEAGDQVEVYFPPEEASPGLKGEHIPLSILYEDEYLLVIDKPAGMSTIPSREHPTGSLANGLVGYYRDIGNEATCHIVTRLDRDTSGVVLVAKHRHVHHLMSKQQKAGHLKRIYEAFAEGIFTEKKGVIEEPIGRKATSIIEREVRPDGQYACTYYQVVAELKGFSYVELRLKTGRTHQIRVHMSYLNHPLLGDDLYGGGIEQLKRQALHCKNIRFIHPFSQKEMTFTAPLPADMNSILDQSKPV